MVVLVDSDSLVYSVPYGCVDIEEVKEKFDTVIRFIVNQIKESYEVDRVLIYHGATGTNFRKEIDSSYKAHRKSEKHEFYYDLSNYVKFVYGAVSAENEEVDDIIANEWRSLREQGIDSCIVSIDKDYKQLPNCLIYNYGKDRKTGDPKGFEFIDEEQARYNFATQMLVGDSADNIKGIKGVGKVGARRILDGATGTFSLFRRVASTYIEKYQENAREELMKSYNLLKIG